MSVNPCEMETTQPAWLVVMVQVQRGGLVKALGHRILNVNSYCNCLRLGAP